MSEKKLYRPKNNRMIWGVCAGVAEYFNVDVTLVRLLWVILTLISLGVVGVVIYIAAGIIIPEEETSSDS